MGLRKDYHGGRAYAADPAKGEAGFAAWLMSKLKGMFRSGSSPLDIRLPSAEHDHSSYSLLGTGSEEAFPPHSGRPVFPMADWAARPGPSPRRRRSSASTDAAAANPGHQDR